MYMKVLFILVLICIIYVCGDFYVGMFKRNDLLVAQDVLYKERIPYRKVQAKYGRIFKCPITYFRVADRLGVGRGPFVQIIRGGLRSKYLVLRMTSLYNYPISVNIYVGCENKMVIRTTPPSKPPPMSSSANTEAVKTTGNDKNGTNTATAGSNLTTTAVAAAG